MNDYLGKYKKTKLAENVETGTDLKKEEIEIVKDQMQNITVHFKIF